MVFEAYIDESGNEQQSSIFVFGGFIASHDEWAKFSDDWQAALDEGPRLEYFKMSEAARLCGQFDKQNGWNEDKRNSKLAQLADIIRRYAKVRVSVWIRHADFETHIVSIPAPVRRLAQDNPYAQLFIQTILAVAVFSDRHGIYEPCEFIFDEQIGFSEEVLQWWPNVKRFVENSTRSDIARFVSKRAKNLRKCIQRLRFCRLSRTRKNDRKRIGAHERPIGNSVRSVLFGGRMIF